jgi:hypothetical protein
MWNNLFVITISNTCTSHSISLTTLLYKSTHFQSFCSLSSYLYIYVFFYIVNLVMDSARDIMPKGTWRIYELCNLICVAGCPLVSAKLKAVVELWQPLTRRWTRHTDNVAGTSGARSKNEATRQWDNSIRRVQFRVRCVPTNNQCKNHNLLMLGRYPHIDTSRHRVDTN